MMGLLKTNDEKKKKGGSAIYLYMGSLETGTFERRGEMVKAKKARFSKFFVVVRQTEEYDFNNVGGVLDLVKKLDGRKNIYVENRKSGATFSGSVALFRREYGRYLGNS